MLIFIIHSLMEQHMSITLPPASTAHLQQWLELLPVHDHFVGAHGIIGKSAQKMQ